MQSKLRLFGVQYRLCEVEMDLNSEQLNDTLEIFNHWEACSCCSAG